MPFKNWILQRMHRMNAIAGRPDLVHRTSRTSLGTEAREPSLRGVPESHDPGSPGPQHLGAYAPLIGAIRGELEHFVSSQLRLHLAIAERDRYLLTSIDVECVDGGDGADLLRRFNREFTPEQIKRFLARDVIAHLPNASSIDLSQFGGLNAASAPGEGRDEDAAYADLRCSSAQPPAAKDRGRSTCRSSAGGSKPMQTSRTEDPAPHPLHRRRRRSPGAGSKSRSTMRTAIAMSRSRRSLPIAATQSARARAAM